MVFGFIKKEGKNSFSLTLNFFILAILIALISVFSAQTLATAGEFNDAGDSSSKSMPAIEEMFTPSSLSLTSLSMTERDDALTQATTARITMYRLYNKYTGEHFYTSNATEKNNLVKASWTYEGVGWYAPKTSKTPVYRLYNPYVSGGDHHYTTNSSERSTLKNAGWKDEGVGWYSTDAGEIDRVPLYRQYNPFAQNGTHNYTQSKSENDKLIKAGWKAEGIGWYGYSKATPSVQPLDFSKIKVTTTAKTYTSKAQTQTITSSAYKLNTDYTVTYSNNKNAGTAKITIKGTGKYTGSRTYNFKINKATLNVSWENVVLTYNAKAQAPQAKVTGVLGSDKVTTSVSGARTNAGENYVATATINNSNYALTGETSKQFTISQLDITNAEVELGEALTYNATKQTQTVASVKVGGVVVPVADYQVTNNQQTNAGTYDGDNALKITPKTNNVTGTPTKEWTISALDVSNATITLGDALTYDATEQKQSVTSVKVGTIELSASDYDLSGNTGKNAGTDYALKVKGKGNFTGEKTKAFEIAKAPLKLKWSNTTFTYDKTEHHPDAAVDSGNKGSDTITVSVAGEETNANKTGESYTATASLDTTSASNYEITTDTKTQTFTIAQATPVYAPTGLKGDYGKALSTVTLPASASAESISWNSSSTLMNDRGSKKFTVTFIPSDTTNYKTLTDLEVAVEVVGVKATFNASAPATGYTITMDDESVNSTVKRLAFDDKAVASPVHTYATADFPTVKITSTNTDGYYFAGWATTSTATYAPTAKQMVDTTVASDIQYYAVWATPKGYWLGSAGATASFTDEAYFAENDINFHSAAEIESDMGVLHDSTVATYTTVKDKWDAYYKDADSSTTGKGNKIRLYATYNGGESQAQYDGSTNVLNKYVEFRILQVGEHDLDGSAVTFMATHLLPKAYSMNSLGNNAGGWGSSSLKSELNSGEVWGKFSTDLKNAIHADQKTYGTAIGTETTIETASNASKFWVLSASELGGSGAPISEGSQYAWCSDQKITYSASNNSALAGWKTRGNATPGSASYINQSWWERSPYTSDSSSFLYVYTGGSVYTNSKASTAWGVAPAFSF